MKVKILTFLLTRFGSRETGLTTFNSDVAEKEINAFIKNKEVIDIKVNTYEARYHNNGGIPDVRIVYTITYKT